MAGGWEQTFTYNSDATVESIEAEGRRILENRTEGIKFQKRRQYNGYREFVCSKRPRERYAYNVLLKYTY